MIVPLTKFVAGFPSKKIAQSLVSGLSGFYGKKTKISYANEGYWSQKGDGWIVNDVYPDVRMNIQKLKELIVDVYFHEYKPKSGDICIDVGAGIGTESIYLSKAIGQTGKIYAIEAVPLTFKLLNANKRDNHLDNMSCFQYAISDVSGKINISSNAGGHEKNSVFASEGESVDAITMDEFIQQHKIDKINFFKTNIEGAEKLLIRKFESISKVHHVAISCHDFLARRLNDETFATRKDIQSFLLANNFEILTRNTGIDYKDDWVYGVNKNF
ncbi:MAG TPA: FkbM family methyltransferase [Puia sp.]|nr:FkbM family methyltransferase [Puia sp.]